MPGSLLQSVNLDSTYTTHWEYTQVGPDRSWANSSTGIMTVPATPAHPFVTGDVMYVRFLSNFTTSITEGKYYAIVVSSTQLKYASTKENALNNISLSIPATIVAPSIGTNGSGIGNTPACGYNFTSFLTAHNPNTWLASSRSADAFDVSKNVRIEVTIQKTKGGSSLALATPNFSSCFGLAFMRTNDVIGWFPGDVASYNINFTGTFRFEIEDRRVSMKVKLVNNSFVTLYTSSQLSPNSAPFYFYANFGLVGTSAADCTITYL